MIASLIAPLARAAMTRDWLVRLIARRRSEGVDRQVAAALELARLLPKLETMQPAHARRFAAGSLADTTLPRAEMAAITDVPVGRIFTPIDSTGDWIVYLHGGGGVIGSIEECEPVARYLAARTRCTVAVPAYRLAPEAKHPAAIVDACAAWHALSSMAPADGRVVVAGDSFGAFLAAHVERHARVVGLRRADLQVLIYPLLDLTLQSPSVERFASGYLLTRPIMEWFRDHYSNPDDDHAANSPWYWTELQGTAPALIITAGFDPLVDEGIGWAERLAEAGTPVRHHHHESLIHSFLSLAGVVRAARAAVDTMCDEIVALLAEEPCAI
jgi:acetyl esterase